MADPSLDTPFLTTREVFTLKLHEWPKLASRYLALGTAGRRALLASTVDRVPLAILDPSSWNTPRDIDSIEWFASASDVCRVYASLADFARRPGLTDIAHALAINDGGLGLNRREWPSIWTKGGSDLGVLTLTYLATNRTGKTSTLLMLDVSGASTSPGAPVIDWWSKVSGNANQFWTFDPVYGQANTYVIINQNSNQCLITDGIAGDQVFQEPCDIDGICGASDTAQWWFTGLNANTVPYTA